MNIEDVLILKPEIFNDKRGFFTEVYKKDLFIKLELPHEFVQINHSGSVKNVLRGLHFQWDPPMGKLMRVTKGNAYLGSVLIPRLLDHGHEIDVVDLLWFGSYYALLGNKPAKVFCFICYL